MDLESFGANVVTLCLLLLLCSLPLLSRFLKRDRDPKEPPDVPTLIPCLGHMIGLLSDRNTYYSILRARTQLPIYSISIAGSRVYVVNSPDIIRAVERQPNTISFWFIEGKATSRIGGMSKEASRKILENVQAGHSAQSLLLDGLNEIRKAMRPGSGVNQMLNVAARTTAGNMDDFRANPSSRRIDLWDWVRHEITIATTEAVYGPTNPYRDRELENAFWAFADDTMMLLPGSLPGLLAPKGYAGREKIVAAFQRYFAAEGFKSGSDLVKARYEVLQRGFNSEDVARFECVNGLAILLNSVPTTFWTIYHIFSDDELLKTVRQQIDTISMLKEDGGRVFRSIDMGRCGELPILASIVQESLRIRTTGVGPRMVLEDVMLNNRYLLKKDSYLMIPNHEIHFDQKTWGDSANAFEAQRFTKTTTKRVPSAAFRGFGGGANLCPGKDFAIAEVTALIAILILRYDLKPEAGHWNDPGQDLSNMSLAIAPPKKRVIVNVVLRKEAEVVVFNSL